MGCMGLFENLESREKYYFSSQSILTFSFAFGELVIGINSHIQTLITDSFHMLSDFTALLLLLISRIMSRRSSSRYSYGKGRMEILGAIISSVFLAALCFTVIVENSMMLITFAVDNDKKDDFIKNTPKDFKQGIIVASIGLAFNISTLILTHFCLMESHHGHSHHQSHQKVSNVDLASKEHEQSSNKIGKDKNKKHEHTNNISLILHIMSDLTGSIIVIAVMLTIKYSCKPDKHYDDNSGGFCKVKLIDPVFSIIQAFVLLFLSIRQTLKNVGTLLQKAPLIDGNKPTELSNQLLRNTGLKIYHLHIWDQIPGDTMATMSLHTSREKCDEDIETCKKYFCTLGIHSVTIQPDFSTCKVENHNAQACCNLSCSNLDINARKCSPNLENVNNTVEKE